MNADAATSGARQISKDEAADLQVKFANMRADVIESNERNRADVIESNERRRADVIAANKESDIQMATWIAETRANRSVTFWIVGIGVGITSLLITGIGLLIGYRDVIFRIFKG